MREATLRITDKKGMWFRMKVATPSNKNKVVEPVGNWVWRRMGGDSLSFLTAEGSWKASDEGFIKFRSGKARPRSSSNGDFTTRDLLILGNDGIRSYDGKDLFGMQLFEFEDVLSVNDEGHGFIIQPWVLAIAPGRIKWTVIG
jgi:hypothetical protein